MEPTTTTNDILKTLSEEGFSRIMRSALIGLIIERHPDNWMEVAETFLIALDDDLICRGNFLLKGE